MHLVKKILNFFLVKTKKIRGFPVRDLLSKIIIQYRTQKARLRNTRLISLLLTEGYASGNTKKWAEARRRKRSVWKNPSPQSVTKYITL
jgi:hypothetical protein